MIEAFVELLQRQARAIAQVESRLRALELVVEAGEQRFLTLALNELETASEQLAGLELTRSLVLSASDLPVDASADELIDRLATNEASATLLRSIIDQLRAGMLSLADSRARTDSAIRSAARASAYRRDAAEAFAAV